MTEDYLTQLTATAADPRDAVYAACRLCGHRVAFRVWPDRDPDALTAFLDGLTQLARRVGLPAYGFWLLGADEDAPDAPSDTQATQVWRATDRHLVYDGTFVEAMGALDADHVCAPRN